MTFPFGFNFHTVGPPSSHNQKFPCLSTTIPSASMPNVSFGACLVAKLAQSETVSVEATSAAVLPNPVGFMIPVTLVLLGLLMVIALKICTESPFNLILYILGAKLGKA